MESGCYFLCFLAPNFLSSYYGLTSHVSRLTYLAEEVLLQDVTGVACADSDGQL